MSRHSWIEKTVARLLLVAFITATSSPAGHAGAQQWEDAENTTFGDDVSLDNSADGLETTFTIDSNQTTIGWEDLQQSEDNTLTFTFKNANRRSTVLNYIGAERSSNLNGTIESNGTVAFSNPYGVFIGNEAVLDVGSLALIAGEITREEFMANEGLSFELDGIVENNGQIIADRSVLLLGREVVNNGEIDVARGQLLMLAGSEIRDLDWDAVTDDFLARKDFRATLAGGRIENNGTIDASNAAMLAGRIANHGEIEIAEGSMMLVAADAVWVRRFDDPVLIKFPTPDSAQNSAPGASEGDGAAPVEYAIENHGRIDAGRGHVRLSAADPLGYGIRQGSGGQIAAKEIEIDGGDTGRVHLSGDIDASDQSRRGRGGEIDVTGSLIVLDDALVDASGTRGGGQIQIGGEQQGLGELAHARAVVIDGESAVRADAIRRGDGGRVIVFSDEFTSVDGTLSARGGARRGDGGFIETSGLGRFAISKTPDVSAPRGEAGAWLIDPYNIHVVAPGTAAVCVDPATPACLNTSILIILDPEFDSAGFDGVIRTVEESYVETDIIARALAVGTDVTLSTQVFGEPQLPEQVGNITIEAPIVIQNVDTLPSTTARLTFLAAGDIIVDADILSLAGVPGEDPNLALSVVLRANDASQLDLSADFDYDQIRGDVVINADIATGGGDFKAQGIAVHQDATSVITTLGGEAELLSGSRDALGIVAVVPRKSRDPGIRPEDGAPDPLFPSAALGGYAPVAVSVEGTLDTSNGADTGGDIRISAASVNVGTGESGKDRIDTVTGLLTVADTANVTSGGGKIDLLGGRLIEDNPSFAANVSIEGNVDSGGGDVVIDAIRPDPDGGKRFTVDFVAADSSETPPRAEGGRIEIDIDPAAPGITTGGGTLQIGSEVARSVSIDGNLDTTQGLGLDENGLITIIALDANGIDEELPTYGLGNITLGANADTTISGAGLLVDGRSITTSDGAGGNAVRIVQDGNSSRELLESLVGEVNLVGRKDVELGANTLVQGEVVRVRAATTPTELNDAERMSTDPQLVFGGSNGPGSTAVDGVRVRADLVAISVGDGVTTSDDLFSEELFSTDPETLGEITDFGLERLSRGSYAGLQLANEANSARPDELSIAQDADFLVSANAVVGEAELNLERAFDARANGPDGMLMTLEASDGVLTIEDAGGLNGADSFITLNGGLLLPVSPTTPPPSPSSVPTANSVVFGDGTTPLAGLAAFDVEGLVVTTPGDFHVDAQVADSITSADELVFEAGRNTGVDGAAGRGELTIDDSTNAILLAAGESLSLRAGASGFGDLVFGSSQPIELRANDLSLRAGAGAASQNTNNNDLSKISGLAPNVTLRDAAGNAFGSNASPADVAFRYQQDEGIDAETDLPTLAQFGLVPADGFRDARDVVYSVRSDAGQILLDDETPGTNEGDRFRDAALSLIGLQTGTDPAVIVSDEFSFQGDSIELGGVGNFSFTQELATAFNRSNANPNAEMKLRAGLGGSGKLDFDRGAEDTVSVVAAKIHLIAGDGTGGETDSDIDVRDALFDLTGAATGEKTFVFHQDDIAFDVSDLPDSTQFVTGPAGLPDILAIRSDSGVLNLQNVDYDALPIDRTGDVRRLILEAGNLSLFTTDTDAPDLDLAREAPDGLRYRFRTNSLLLGASNSDDENDGGRVLAGDDVTPIVTIGNDSDFDDQTLLVEAFELESEEVTLENLSELSADEQGVVDFDLADGRGPTNFTIEQDGAAALSDLPDRDSFSGFFGRSLLDDADDAAIPTSYSITSFFGTVAIDPSKVDSSNLQLVGSAPLPNLSAFDIAAASYDLAGFTAITEDSILIQRNTTLDVGDGEIELAAGVIPFDFDPDEPFVLRRSLVFDSLAGDRTIDLRGNRILLSAGPAFLITNPDGPDDDKDRDEIPDALLPNIDLAGLDQVERQGDAENSLVRFQQNASFDFTEDIDYGAARWETLDVLSIQGDLQISGFDVLQGATENLTLQNGIEGAIIADVENQLVTFDDFLGTVRIESNDITFRTDDAATQIDIGAENLELLSIATQNGLEADSDRYKLRSDPDVLERPIVRVEQVADFDGTQLPTAGQYLIERIFFTADGTTTSETSRRQDLGSIDIELVRTGGDFTLENGIRDRVIGANLTVISAGDVTITLDGVPAGYQDIDSPALDLASLDIQTNSGAGGGEIRFQIAGFPTAGQLSQGFDPPAVSTLGDQALDGTLVLDDSLDLRGRDITMVGDISTTTGSGLRVRTSGKLTLGGDSIGSAANRLDFFEILFDADAGGAPVVEFGLRTDDDADDIAETPIDSDQTVWVENDIVFETDNGSATEVGEREGNVLFASIGKALGDLTFDSANGDFVMGDGERLSVGGTTTVTTPNGDARIADVSTLDLSINAGTISLVRRGSSLHYDNQGETTTDRGPMIVANNFDFTGAVQLVGKGRDPRFGVPTPFDSQSLPSVLDDFAVFAIKPSKRLLNEGDFRFDATREEFLASVPSIVATGASRSDLSGAFGPRKVAAPGRPIPEPYLLAEPERLSELAVDAYPTPSSVIVARLEGVSVIDDLSLTTDPVFVSVTEARLDAADAELAIALYEEIFGPDGERASHVRSVLQLSLDQYLETTRARRVVGFELRRFVKNRPSTLLEAYTTLDQLDTLFRYHRRLGLSEGEYRKVQLEWLREIQPDGITLEELSEAIHPSRYVRGSDILDIFGE